MAIRPLASGTLDHSSSTRSLSSDEGNSSQIEHCQEVWETGAKFAGERGASAEQGARLHGPDPALPEQPLRANDKFVTFTRAPAMGTTGAGSFRSGQQSRLCQEHLLGGRGASENNEPPYRSPLHGKSQIAARIEAGASVKRISHINIEVSGCRAN